MDGSSPTAKRCPPLSVAWSTIDRHRVVTLVGVIGLAIAVWMGVFGLPPLDLHGPLHRAGIMDPFCGGTRAARLTAQGHLAEAWVYNPLGILATVLAALVAMRLAVGAFTGRWLNVDIVWTPRRIRVVLALTLMATVALEIRQQGRADLLLRAY